MHEIPDTINIIDGPPNPNEVADDIVFDERHNNDASSDDEPGQSNQTKNSKGGNDSLSEDESDDEDEEENFNNPNRMPKKTGNLNAGNLIGSKKDSGKGARNDRRAALSGSDSDEVDELGHI